MGGKTLILVLHWARQEAGRIRKLSGRHQAEATDRRDRKGITALVH